MGQQASTTPKITAQDRAIYQMKQQRDKLKQYQTRLSTVIDRQNNLAKEAILRKDLDRAKFYLRSKKQQETTISKTYEQLDNLEKLIGTIEFKVIEKDVMYGLQQGNEVLKKLNSEMSMDKLDKILDDLEDERVKVDDVSDMLGMGSLTNGDELEVEEELARLEEQVTGKSKINQSLDLPDAPKVSILPEAPSGKLESNKKNSEKASSLEESQPIAA
ncbi:vacuolar protein sorting-associated protein 20 [[Candida] anglica]|uniref:Vacuolar protein sorting-associated protein 20 n=1 Tax=[Candida] anglica TaxID=148631 RepID=A0ABP0EAK0_9ASCO